MITKEEMARIRSEEIYRHEVRRKLNGDENSPSKRLLWEFVNSSFGIWLLSTVVVGLIVYFYNDIKLKNELSANEAATIQQLETEISNRLQQFVATLSNQEPLKLYYQKEELAYMVDGVLITDGTLTQKKPIYIFPEYKERTMNSLLYELGRITQDKQQSSTITSARSVLDNIKNAILAMEDPPMPDFSISQRLQQMAQVAPENLAAHESELLAEYHEKKARFDQGPMRDYSEKIKRQLNDLQRMVEKNPFLKKMLA